jgi:hypothetical protein
VIALADVWTLAEARLADANALRSAKRFAGAVYLYGYAVELGLKARTCRTLGWTEWPDTGAEFGGLKCLKTHDLVTLLRVSGMEIPIKSDGYLFAAWSIASEWDPETRYRVPDKDASTFDAELMAEATNALLEVFRK